MQLLYSLDIVDKIKMERTAS